MKTDQHRSRWVAYNEAEWLVIQNVISTAAGPRSGSIEVRQALTNAGEAFSAARFILDDPNHRPNAALAAEWKKVGVRAKEMKKALIKAKEKLGHGNAPDPFFWGRWYSYDDENLSPGLDPSPATPEDFIDRCVRLAAGKAESLTRRATPRAKNMVRSGYYKQILDIWSELGGRLAISTNPYTGRRQGRLIKFMQAVTSPVMGKDAPSAEAIRDIVRREKKRGPSSKTR